MAGTHADAHDRMVRSVHSSRRTAHKMMGKKGGHSSAHPGFEAVQEKIAAKQGVSKERAGAILGASSRGASAAAKKKNPRLFRVKGKS